MIQALETRYQGYRFRSRLEARWAVFFDAMGLRWLYELQGYRLGCLGPYLPDFALARADGEPYAWAEVKSTGTLDDATIPKARALAAGTGLPALILVGVPGDERFIEVFADGGRDLSSDPLRWARVRHECATTEDFRSPDAGQTRLLAGELIRAAAAARSARFEYGETPDVANHAHHQDGRGRRAS